MRIENGGVYSDTEGRILVRETPVEMFLRRKLALPAEAPDAPWINQDPGFWTDNDN